MTKKISIKDILVKVSLIIGYIWLLRPYIYSVYYSMPANDDFALGINWWGHTIIGEAFIRAGWNYMHWFGQSGIFAVIIQVLFNPLYWFNDRGHSFGICMIFVFLFVLFGTLYSVRRLLKLISNTSDKIVLDVFTFLTALLLLTSYYYSDVYNWWSGVPGYSLMMMLNIINFGNIVKYEKTHEKSDYIWMIVTGVITCTSLMNCVATGLFYILYVFINKYRSNDKLFKRVLPLCLYIISGILMVLAPGNYERKGGSSKPEYLESIFVTLYRVKTRFMISWQTRPWIVLLVFLILLIGIYTKTDCKPKLYVILLGYVCTLVAAVGSVYPYVLGSNKTYESEFTPRVYFVEDYLVFIGFAILTFRLGQWIAIKFKLEINMYVLMSLSVIAILFNYIYCNMKQEEIGVLIPTDIMANAELIKESYDFWDDIIQEIVESSEKDIEISRDNVDWCQYVYYTSLDDGASDWDWSGNEKIYYGGCNQCAAIFYGKDRIRVYLQ